MLSKLIRGTQLEADMFLMKFFSPTYLFFSITFFIVTFTKDKPVMLIFAIFCWLAAVSCFTEYCRLRDQYLMDAFYDL